MREGIRVAEINWKWKIDKRCASFKELFIKMRKIYFFWGTKKGKKTQNDLKFHSESEINIEVSNVRRNRRRLK